MLKVFAALPAKNRVGLVCRELAALAGSGDWSRRILTALLGEQLCPDNAGRHGNDAVTNNHRQSGDGLTQRSMGCDITVRFSTQNRKTTIFLPEFTSALKRMLALPT